MAVDTGTVSQTPTFDSNKTHGMCKTIASVHNSRCRVRYTSALNLHLRPISTHDIMEITELLGLQTTRSHRRIASNPFPIPSMNPQQSTEDGSVSGDEGDTESIANTESRRTSEDTTSIDADSPAAHQSNTLLLQSLEIPDLCHSPTLNRRSVSIFNFCEDLVLEDPETVPSSENNSPKMAAAILNKIHRSFNNLTSSPSIDSFEREDYRGMVLREILETEQTYVSSLDTLISVFLPALETIVAPRDVRLLFPCQLEPMIAMHQSLYEKLEERIDGISRWHGIVGDIFGRLCSNKEREFISVYSAYMNEFKVAMQTLVKYQNTSPLFCKEASNCSKKHNFEGLSLSSFLLTPIQRLPRYELLLKQLMKHTQEDHPDFYYLEAALETLHSDLTTLDRSIQACQFASTVGSLKDEGRKRSIKKHNRSRRRQQSSRFARIKRHFSSANIDDFASSPTSQRSVSALEKSSSFAVSEYNIADKMDDSNSRPSSSLGVSLTTSRAISCSEVHLVDSEKSPKVLLSEGEEKQEEFEDDDERTPCMSHSSSITSHESIIVLGKRGSVYSTNSSTTSGFDSLTGMMIEGDFDEKGYDSTLRPVQATNSTSSNDSGFRDGREDVSTSTPTNTTGKPNYRKKSSLSSALKVIRKASKDIGNSPLTRQKRTSSSGNVNKLNISDPMDFRHIQHGFSSRPVSFAL